MQYENEDKGCGLCKSCLSIERHLLIANIFYAVFFVCIGILSFIVYNTSEKWLYKLLPTKYESVQTMRLFSVIRISFPLAIWYLIHAVVTVCNDQLDDTSWRFRFHTKALYLHAFGYFVILLAFWYIPDQFYEGYIIFSIIASAFYLVLQFVFLIYLFLTLNDKLTEGTKLCLPITITVIFEAGALTVYGVSYYLFAKGSCQSNIILISVNLCICVILFILSIFIPRGSILIVSLISAYCAYLTVSGLICLRTCNRLSSSSNNLGFAISSSLITLIWAGYSAFSGTNNFKALIISNEEDKIIPAFSMFFFHSLFTLASFYMGMVVTSWGMADPDHEWMVDKGKIAKWINFASSWVIMALYLWVLIAPYVCRNREFS